MGICTGKTPVVEPASVPMAAVRDAADVSLSVRLRCSDGQRHVLQVDRAWTLQRFENQVSRKTQVSSSSLRLTLAGRSLVPSKSHTTIGDVPGLSDGAIVFVTIVRDKFPEKLGPFLTTVVPLTRDDIRCPEPSQVTHTSAPWTLTKGDVIGQMSPTYAITLTAEAKQEANIPAEAQWFSWSYPVPDWQKLCSGTSFSPLVVSFLQVGGFIYFDANQVVQVTTLMPTQRDEGGLQFSRPRPWRREWTKELDRQGRFHDVTIETLKAAGARRFCWLKPMEAAEAKVARAQNRNGYDEVFIHADEGGPHIKVRNGTKLNVVKNDGEFLVVEYRGGTYKVKRHNVELAVENPDVPHGGFVYQFSDHALDRYFAVVSGDEYRPVPDGASTSPFHLFERAVTQRFDTRGSVFGQGLDLVEYPPPGHWQPRRKQGDTAQQVVQIRDPAVLQSFQELITRTHKTERNWTRDRGRNKVPQGYIVQSVYRNESPMLWAQYCRTRDAISEECRATVKSENVESSEILEGLRVNERINEWRLFHGSSSSACHSIMENNFTLDFAGMGATWKAPGDVSGTPLYGFGVYFAEHFTKCDEYSKPMEDDSHIYSALICRVVGGRSRVVQTNDVDADELQSQVLDGPFHSVLGDRVTVLQKPYREFVVYERHQIYPEYLVQYHRQM